MYPWLTLSGDKSFHRCLGARKLICWSEFPRFSQKLVELKKKKKEKKKQIRRRKRKRNFKF